jgi:cell shape-determining protein MreC
LLIVDAASKLPAVVQHGRWWAIAIGTQTHLKLQYVSQDAKLQVGDVVVTGEGRSFHAGTLIGRICRFRRPTRARSTRARSSNRPSNVRIA